jgi:sec-independent protein translocase protein TatB
MLVGIVALIFLGPRKLPGMARKIGKIMAEFRSTTNEFKETWQREVNFEEELKSLDINDIEAETTSRQPALPLEAAAAEPTMPSIRPADPANFENLPSADDKVVIEPQPAPAEPNDKTNWL